MSHLCLPIGRLLRRVASGRRPGDALIVQSLALIMLSAPLARKSAAIETVFDVVEEESYLTIEATARILIFTVSDDDEQSLGGTINAMFDFGSTGAFPPTADFEVTSAAVTHLSPFQLTLGDPPLAAYVSVNDAIVDVTTPSPPAALSLTGDPGIVYEFDAAEFEIGIVAGIATVTGAFNDSVDFAETPALGSADPGTLGELTLVATPHGDSEMLVDARLELPIDFVEVVDFEGATVTLDVDGLVVANSRFMVDLSGEPGDFDGNGVVDGADFLVWQRGELDVPLEPDDLAEWEANFGMSSASPAAQAGAVPEPPGAASLLLLAAGVVLLRRQPGKRASTATASLLVAKP